MSGLKLFCFVTGASCTCTVKVAATVAVGAIGAIKTGKPDHSAGQEVGEGNILACVNVSMTKTTLAVAVCALPTDVAYNRWAACFLSPEPPALPGLVIGGLGTVHFKCWRLLHFVTGGRGKREGKESCAVACVLCWGRWYDGTGRVIVVENDVSNGVLRDMKALHRAVDATQIEAVQ